MSNKLSRRQFLKALGAAGAGLLTTGLLGKNLPRVIAQAWNDHLYLPLVSRGGTIPSSTGTPPTTISPGETSTPTSTSTSTASGPTAIPTTPVPPSSDPRVVHVHNPDATSWTGSTDYWKNVNQNVIDNMVDRGMLDLTGTSSLTDAWRSFLPEYQPGQGIAIKVSFNNTNNTNDVDGQIDAVIEPVNAIIRGLTQIGVAEQDIWVYDAVRVIPERFISRCQFTGIQYFSKGTENFESNDPNSYITFSPPSGTPPPSPIKIADVLIDATYLINMPIMKYHTGAGVSLAFKNHFGSINHPGDLHDYITTWGSNFNSNYSPIVDVYKNPHIVGKTILTIADGLFAGKNGQTKPPAVWTTFGNNVPNSIFIANDALAVDCIMHDLLTAETDIPPHADDYMILAGQSGLGVFEHGDPWGSGYSKIDYQKVEL